MRLILLVLVAACFLLSVGWIVLGMWPAAGMFAVAGLIGLRSALRIPSGN